MVSDEAKKLKSKARASLTLLLVAVISITTATYAWFSISNSTTVKNMEIQVGTGVNLMVSTAENGTYVTTLENAEINALITANNPKLTKGLEDIRLWPLTSGNGSKLYLQGANTSNGTPSTATTGYYLELPLWFKSNANMDVYLNGDNTPDVAAGSENGTSITSNTGNAALQNKVAEAVRLSLCPEGDSVTYKIYEPNKSAATTLNGLAKTDAGSATQTTFVALGTNSGLSNGGDNTEVLFSLTKDTAKKVVLRVWIEGEDPQCINDDAKGINLEKAKLDIRLRFCGADSDGKYMEGATA